MSILFFFPIFLQVVSVKVHVSPLASAEERTLRAKGDVLMDLAMSDQPGTFMDRMPLPLAYATCLPPFSVLSSILTVNVDTWNNVGTNTIHQVVEIVGEHALVVLPSRSLTNLLGELNLVSMSASLFRALATPSTASRNFSWMDDRVGHGVMRETTFSTGMSFNQASWWADSISIPVSALRSERFGPDWLALSGAEEANFINEKMPEEVAEAARNIVGLRPNGDATDRAMVPTRVMKTVTTRVSSASAADQALTC